MRASVVFAGSFLAATALAAPNAQWWNNRPAQYGRPTTTIGKAVSSDCGAVIATTTAYITITEHDEATASAPSESTTSSAVVVDPTDAVSSSSTTVASDCTATTAVATLTETTTAVSTSTVVVSGDVTTAYSTVTVSEIATITAPYSGGNNTVPSPTGTPQKCITPSEAEELAEVFRLLIQEYSTGLALAALTEDFVDYSSAVNILMNKGAQYPKNITGPTFASRAAFMAGQGSQPQIPFERLNTFYGCDSVSVRWMTTRSGNGQKTEAAMIPVVGNGIMKVVPSPEEVQTYKGVTYNWRVQTLYSEFNAAAWLVNLGVFRPEGPVDYINQNATASTTKRSIEHFDETLRGAMI